MKIKREREREFESNVSVYRATEETKIKKST
jgi:hypothetical protein